MRDVREEVWCVVAGVVWVVQWGEDVAGMAYGVDMCVCGVVRT